MNRKLFFDHIRQKHVGLFSGRLSQSQVDSMNRILDRCILYGCELGQAAGILATTRQEAGAKMVPVREIGQGDGKPYGVPTGPYSHVYYGRGLVQITWLENYEKASKHVGVDLVRYPDKALDPVIATELLVRGMMEGWYTGKKLPEYINETTRDWKNSRRVVNGLDRWDTIEGFAQAFQDALIVAGYQKEQTAPPPTVEPEEPKMEEPLKGKKTFILSVLYGIAAIVEILGYFDFPFIDDPWQQIQLAATAIFLRLGIGAAQK